MSFLHLHPQYSEGHGHKVGIQFRIVEFIFKLSGAIICLELGGGVIFLRRAPDHDDDEVE